MDKNKIMGLTQREVKERQAEGLVNDFTASASTSTWQIVKRNVFTLFNALNFAIALALAFVQAWSNLVFFAVICFNAFSGIVTERATSQTHGGQAQSHDQGKGQNHP